MRTLLGFALAAALLGGRPGLAADPEPQPTFHFSFDQVDIRTLVKVAGEMTGRRFIVDDRVTGRVTVVSPDRLRRDEVLPLLQSALEASGFTMADNGDSIRVVPLAKGDSTIGGVVGPDQVTPASGLITKVIRVSNINAMELKKLLEPMIRGGKDGAVVAFSGSNHIVLTDTAENIRQAEKIIAELDKAGAARVVRVVTLEHAEAAAMAADLMSAIKGSDSAGARVSRHLQQVGEGLAALPTDVLVVPSQKANSLVLVGTPVQLQELQELIRLLDVESKTGTGRLHVIFLKYLVAEDAAKSINGLLAKTQDKDKRSSIALEPNMANNALLVECSAPDFEIVSRLVKELDTTPQQVLVEVVIAEVAAGRNVDLGVTLSTVEIPEGNANGAVGRSRPGSSDVVLDALTQGLFPQGMLVGVAHGSSRNADGTLVPNIAAAINALAKNRDVKILANPSVWAQNNAEASFSVVENIPVLRSTIEGGSGTSRDVIQNIDRLDVGIKLKLTPHVNPDNEITLKLNPVIEAIVDQSTDGQAFAPSIAKREINTTVTVSNENTIVISGLIREDRIKEVAKVPLLGDIPVLGWLFRSTSERRQRTNVLVLVTPHLVTDVREARRMKEALERKTELRPEDTAPLGSAPAPAP